MDQIVYHAVQPAKTMEGATTESLALGSATVTMAGMEEIAALAAVGTLGPAVKFVLPAA